MSQGKSFINLCATLTLCRFCSEIILKDCPEADKGTRKIRRLATRIVDTVTTTRDLWPDATPDDVRRVEDMVRILGARILEGDRELLEVISVALGMLSDMLQHLRGPRREAIEHLETLMYALSTEFDRRGERAELYEAASSAVGEWYSVIGQ